MNRKFVLPMILIAGVIAMAYAADKPSEEQNGLLRHVVCFKFKETSSQESIDQVVNAFVALEDKIPFMVDFEWGTNVSPEGLNKGFTHCFVATFKTAADRDKYLPHPAHQQFVEVLKPHIDDVFVVDYWTK